MHDIELLAKRDPDISLIDHSLSVLKYAREIIDNAKDSILNKSALIASAFHDIGKADDTFQSHIRGKGKGNPHPLLALPIVKSILDNNKIEEYYKDLILLAIVSHHTPLRDSLYESKNPRLMVTNINRLKDIINRLSSELDLNSNMDIDEINGTRPKKIYVESNARAVNDYNDKRKLREDFIYIQGILETADWLASGNDKLIRLDFPNLVAKKYDYQDAVRTIHNNIFIMLPTGAGKTETALYWTEANYNYPYRIFYILPTITTINAMFKRLNEKFNKIGVGEYHSNIDLFLDLESDEENNSDEYVTNDLLLTYKYYFMPLNVTTPDQLLLTLMNYKKFTLKSYSLYKALIIFDEIHVYDAETFGLIKFLIRYLHEHYNTKFCIMSATFPNKLKDELSFLNAHELMKGDVDKYYKSRFRTKIHYNDYTIDNAINDIIESSKSNTTLVVVNTVKRAQELYKKIREEASNINIELLHSRYIFKDRREKEERLASKNNIPKLLIATQLVEVSLDISYYTLFTEACYIDSLIQRCGRVNRYNEYKAPSLVNIFKPINYHPYNEKLLNHSIDIIANEEDNIKSEYDYVRITNRFYDDIWDDIKSEGDNRFYNIWNKCKYIYSINLEDEEAQELLKTRSGILSIPVYPWEFRDHIQSLQEKIKNSNDKNEKFELRREQRQYLVNVPFISELKDKIHLDKIYGKSFIFINTKYDEELGLTAEVDNMI
jgi:CRISPR-associated endonuclease/helicase Cas3